MSWWIGILIVFVYCVLLAVDLVRLFVEQGHKRQHAIVRQKIEELHDRIESHARSGNMAQVSEILRTLNLEFDHPVILVGALRMTFSFRSYLPQWWITRTHVAAALRRRGFDADQLLVGLFEDS